MKLNWPKIAFIVLCAEILLIYWNGMSATPFKKQQNVHPISTLQPAQPVTQVEEKVPWQINEFKFFQVHQLTS
ncbi:MULTISPECIES: hypothetical protein [Paenibacillus]|uniref:Uncharacterized protein n=1 Tax=Paenibacillus violae TaxID=3077234 RepID=A0ABU3RJG7_9BACL|nr:MULTISPECIES: hypothetical protein [Paenibacillus]MDU0204174.1 hypothetical protein [Paenibacillus sp. PFR10]MEC0266533.1 hypothetical protein [Paenibacillus anseongense]